MNAIDVANLKKENTSMIKIYFNNAGDIVLENCNQNKRIIYKRYQMQVEEKLENRGKLDA